jgi:large subunit ribosomal protein L7/L12
VNVSSLRCNNCLAPVDPARGSMQRCSYCGMVLVLGGEVKAPPLPIPGGVLGLDACGPNKIHVIRVIREHMGLGLKEAKELSDSAPCTLAEGLDAVRFQEFHDELVAAGARVSGTAPTAGLMPAVSGGASPVFLEACGPNKIQVIKVIRDHPGLGLKEAKDLSEAAPCVLAEGMSAPRAERFRAELVLAGARAR